MGEEEGAIEIAARAVAGDRAARVEFPIPEGEDEDVGDPENASGTEKLFRRFEMKRQAVDEKEKGRNEGDGQQGVGDEGEGAHHADVSTAIRNDDHGEQDKNDREKEPAGTDREAFGERPIKEAGGHHREEGGPARLVEFFLGHENSESEDRIILAAENVHRNLKICAGRVDGRTISEVVEKQQVWLRAARQAELRFFGESTVCRQLEDSKTVIGRVRNA